MDSSNDNGYVDGRQVWINPVTAARQKKRLAKRKTERQNKKQARQRK